MWLIYQEFKDIKESINLNNVSSIVCDSKSKTLGFYGISQDQDNDDTLIMIEMFEFGDAKQVEDLYLAIMQEIAKGANVFEVTFPNLKESPQHLRFLSDSYN